MGALVMVYEVVMATCNGERFLDEQIASILQQTVPPQRVLVADDASSDRTIQQLRSWQKRSRILIECLPSSGSNRLGSCRNFERLLQASEAPYVMLSDQDDCWDSDKAERLLKRMLSLENSFGIDQPLLVHADLRLIDPQGQPLASSFHRCQGLYPQRNALLDLGLQNVVTGCASLVNRACLRQALPFPADVVLHDWWLALVASRAGHIAYLPEPCVSYRQHGSNLVGAAGWPAQARLRMRQALTTNPAAFVDRLISPGLLQIRACLHRFGPERLALSFELLWSRSVWVRLRTALRLGLRKHGPWRTAGFYVALLMWQPSAR